MEYSSIPIRARNEILAICKPPANGEVDLAKAEKEPSYFAFHLLGIQPYTYQYMIMKKVRQCAEAHHYPRRIAVCSSRQIGKSISVAIISLWAALYNKFPSGINRNTKVCVISKTDDQAKKLMGEIKKLINIGDTWIRNATGEAKFLSKKLDPNGINNMTQMSLLNGATIKSFPPTDSIRGESADIVIVDEAAFVDEDIFREAIEPTVSATGGIILLTSTPKGQSGLWFNLFDPFDKLSTHEYVRLWFPWTICENKAQKKDIEKKLLRAQEAGVTKSFDQEYNALFTIDEDAFFSSIKVDAGASPHLDMVDTWKKTPCCIGVDYGMTACHSVITVSTFAKHDKYGEVVLLLFQHVYPLDSDDNLIVDDILDLCSRFRITKIVADDCAQGNTNNQKMQNLGLPIQLYNFRSEQARAAREGYDRNSGYYAFRYWLNKNKIKYPRIKELIIEMKALQETKKQMYTSIRKPKGGSDDRIDSFMMSTLPFISEDEVGVTTMTIDPAKPFEMFNNKGTIREDLTWQGFVEWSDKFGGKE